MIVRDATLFAIRNILKGDARHVKRSPQFIRMSLCGTYRSVWLRHEQRRAKNHPRNRAWRQPGWSAVGGPRHHRPGDPRPRGQCRRERGGRGDRCAQVDRVPAARRAGGARPGRAEHRPREVPARIRHPAPGQLDPRAHRPGSPVPATARRPGRRPRRDDQHRRRSRALRRQRAAGDGHRRCRQSELGRPAHPAARHRQRQGPPRVHARGASRCDLPRKPASRS